MSSYCALYLTTLSDIPLITTPFCGFHLAESRVTTWADL